MFVCVWVRVCVMICPNWRSRRIGDFEEYMKSQQSARKTYVRAKQTTTTATRTATTRASCATLTYSSRFPVWQQPSRLLVDVLAV